MRHFLLFSISALIFISIHAPLTGCDGVHKRKIAYTVEFQSTHPLRDATLGYTAKSGVDNIFQSTHPLRDATHGRYYRLQHDRDFNPRTPYGMRHCCYGRSTYRRNFNPRTPYGMRPWGNGRGTNNRSISIHAPLTGCDFWILPRRH